MMGYLLNQLSILSIASNIVLLFDNVFTKERGMGGIVTRMKLGNSAVSQRESEREMIVPCVAYAHSLSPLGFNPLQLSLSLSFPSTPAQTFGWGITVFLQQLSFCVGPLIALLFVGKGQNFYFNLLMFLVAILSLTFFLCGERIGHGFRQVPPDPLYFRKIAKVLCGCWMRGKTRSGSQSLREREEVREGKGGFEREGASKQGGNNTGRKTGNNLGVEQGSSVITRWCNCETRCG